MLQSLRPEEYLENIGKHADEYNKANVPTLKLACTEAESLDYCFEGNVMMMMMTMMMMMMAIVWTDWMNNLSDKDRSS